MINVIKSTQSLPKGEKIVAKYLIHVKKLSVDEYNRLISSKVSEKSEPIGSVRYKLPDDKFGLPQSIVVNFRGDAYLHTMDLNPTFERELRQKEKNDPTKTVWVLDPFAVE